MKKISGIICFIVGLCIVFAACSDSESYADRVEREKKAISRFINENNIQVLNEYPSNGVFQSNQFYLDPSGVYINVIDSGNGKRADASKRAEVYFRFKDRIWLPASESDTVSLSNLSVYPLSFNYGVSATYTGDYNTNQISFYYLSPGIVEPLKYVGENAKVRLIVPFRDRAGSAFQISSFQTVYFGEVEYTRIIN